MAQIRRKEPNAMNTSECKKVLSLLLSLRLLHFWSYLFYSKTKKHNRIKENLEIIVTFYVTSALLLYINYRRILV